MNTTLARIEQWYTAQCDGHWEHKFGVKIDTLDNPGWLVQINLAGTNLEKREFKPLTEGMDSPSSTRWHSISVKNATFEAAGDPTKLEFMLRAFLDWAEQQAEKGK